MTRGSLSITQETLNRSREAESCFAVATCVWQRLQPGFTSLSYEVGLEMHETCDDNNTVIWNTELVEELLSVKQSIVSKYNLNSSGVFNPLF